MMGTASSNVILDSLLANRADLLNLVVAKTLSKVPHLHDDERRVHLQDHPVPFSRCPGPLVPAALRAHDLNTIAGVKLFGLVAHESSPLSLRCLSDPIVLDLCQDRLPVIPPYLLTHPLVVLTTQVRILRARKVYPVAIQPAPVHEQQVLLVTVALDGAVGGRLVPLTHGQQVDVVERRLVPEENLSGPNRCEGKRPRHPAHLPAGSPRP